jgi:hypothetical protein
MTQEEPLITFNNKSNSIKFVDDRGEICGEITFKDGQINFDGNVSESAEKLFKFLTNLFKDELRNIENQKTNNFLAFLINELKGLEETGIIKILKPQFLGLDWREKKNEQLV